MCDPPPSYYEPPEPKCSEDCDCETCHKQHIDDGVVEENSIGSNILQCCADQMEEWYQTGERCQDHPNDYSEKGYCEGCIKEKGESVI